MKYTTELFFSNRQEKSVYVFDKYKDILNKTILDVGGDRRHLKNLLSENVFYESVGMEDDHDYKINLEKGLKGVKSSYYETVLCLDVLEHIEKIHFLFDELCRVSNNYIIISMPNPWLDFFSTLCAGRYSNELSMKFYNLPCEIPLDRHRWFYNTTDLKSFLYYMAEKNSFEIIQVDQKLSGNIMKKRLLAILLKLFKIKLHKSIKYEDLFGSTVWCVLKKKKGNND